MNPLFLHHRRLLMLSAIFSFLSLSLFSQADESKPVYQPTAESLNQHELPEWFRDAKFGIFIHWGPYSIPAYAPNHKQSKAGLGDISLNPYAEWYLNTMKFEDSPTAKFHRETYGEDYSYDRFGEAFNESLKDWDPKEWASNFKQSGARYVVLVTKHHDGFLMWPSDTPNPFKENWAATRDIVGELAEAVKAEGMRFGVYYSGGVDWTFKGDRVGSITDLVKGIPGDAESYTEYTNAHYKELIDKYSPDYLWNDIGYPTDDAAFEVMAHFYNGNPDGLVNDRWMSPAGFGKPGVFDERPEGFSGMIVPAPPVWGVRTPEYGIFDRVMPFYWESARGFSKSFSFNRLDTEKDLISPDDIITMLTQAAVFNGNVLLNVGPKGDAQLDPMQTSRLKVVGAWMEKHAQYIQDTRPVALSQGDIAGAKVGAATRDNQLFIHIMGQPSENTVRIALPDGWSASDAKFVGAVDGSIKVEKNELVISVKQWLDAATQIVEVTKH